jgi:hypothetical protein
MLYEKFYGIQEQFLGWKCIFCGEIVDEVIMENRRDARAHVSRKLRNGRR